MLRNFFSSLRVRLFLFVLLAALPALGLTLYTGLEQRRQAASEAQADALRLVHFITENHELIIENTRGFLIALSHAFSSRYGQISQCGDVFSHLMETHFPYYSAFYIADLDTNIICSMLHGDVPDDLETCEHYQELIHAEGFVTSQYHICRNTGKGVIAIGYPLRDSNDRVEGVINVSLDLAWFLGEVFVLRQTKTLMNTTERLAAGDLSARTQIAHLPGEIGQLASAFDQMAESLAQREAERSQAEQAMKEYAANLERSNRDRQDFANIASHDLQEPLRKNQVFSVLLQMRYSEELDERSVEYIERMQEAARRMQLLIQDLLT